MYKSRNVKCADCKDVFRIEYDSRKDKQDVYTCKCVKLKCYPNSYGSFSYDRNGRYEDMSWEDQEYKSLNYEEDYIKLSDEANLLLSEINDIARQLNKGEYKASFYNYTDEDKLSLELYGCSNLNEGLSIQVDIRLKDDKGWKNQEEKRKKEERIIEALSRFKSILTKVKNKELDLNKPKKVWDDKSLEWYDGTKTQQKLYDYELVC